MLTDALKSFADLAFPRPCVVCGVRLNAHEKYLCVRCRAMLPYYRNGDFSNNTVYERMLCGFEPRRCGALFDYSHGSDIHRLFFQIKYGGRKDIALAMGRELAQVLGKGGFFEGIDLVVPVPLHQKRLVSRGYNQAERLASGVCEAAGLCLEADVLVRVVDNVSQTGKTKEERLDNVEGIFRLQRAEAARQKHVLLIDDVVTTGATLVSCARMLLDTAAAVSVVALAATR